MKIQSTVAAATLAAGASVAFASAASATTPARSMPSAVVTPNTTQVTCDDGSKGFLYVVVGTEKRCYANAGTTLFSNNPSPLIQLYGGNNAGSVLWQDASGCFETPFQKYQ